MESFKAFSTRVKYPRTPHFPFSPTTTVDDKILNDTKHFEGKEVVATVKLDGENTTLYSDYFHARSLDSMSHPSQAWVKQFHAGIAHEIPKGWRICGENLYAKHSIHYKNLDSYFYVFSVWDEKNNCLSWDDTLNIAEMLNLKTAYQLYRGPWDEETIQNLWKPVINNDECEGFVVRLTSSFSYNEFGTSVAKYVRKGHVQPNTGHWKSQKVVPNTLRGV